MYRRKNKRTGDPTGPWYITVGGRRVSSGTQDKGRARKKEQKDNTRLWDEGNGFVAQTWGSACARWIDNNPSLAESDNILYWIEWWSERLGAARRLETINPTMVHEILVKDRPGISMDVATKPNATANNYVSFLQRVIHETSTLRPKFQVYPRLSGEKRWSPIPEWLSIAAHLTQDQSDVITWAVASGLRESNCMHYQWGWDRETWGYVPFTKNGDPLGIPYNRTMQAIMKRRREMAVKHVRYVFTDGLAEWTTDKVLTALRKATTAAHVEYITFHGLRHTFNTWLARAHVPQEIRERLCGHRGKRSNDIYTHYDVEHLRPYAEIIDRLLAGERVSLIPHTMPENIIKSVA